LGQLFAVVFAIAKPSPARPVEPGYRREGRADATAPTAPRPAASPKGQAMKIALIIERMEPSRGGRETSTAQIAQRLAELGHSVTVLCQQGSWPSDSPGVEVVSLGAGY